MKFYQLASALCVLILSVSEVTFAVEYLPYKTKGRLKFGNQVHNFGTVSRGQKLQADFTFENIGQGPIIVQGVHASCGCTATQVEKGKVYEYGDKGAIKVSFDTSDFVGNVAKIVTVMTNEAALPARTLTLKANVVGDLGASPPLADFGNVPVGSTPTIKLSLKNNSASPITINKLLFSDNIVKAGYVREGNGWVVSLTLSKNLPTGFLSEKLVIRNSSKLQSDFVIPIRANILNLIEHSPRYLEFGSVSAGKKIEKTITLKSNGNFKIRKPSVELMLNGEKFGNSRQVITVDLIKEEQGKRTYAVRLHGQSSYKGSIHGRLNFAVDSRIQDSLAIDLYGILL